MAWLSGLKLQRWVSGNNNNIIMETYLDTGTWVANQFSFECLGQFDSHRPLTRVCVSWFLSLINQNPARKTKFDSPSRDCKALSKPIPSSVPMTDWGFQRDSWYPNGFQRQPGELHNSSQQATRCDRRWWKFNAEVAYQSSWVCTNLTCTSPRTEASNTGCSESAFRLLTLFKDSVAFPFLCNAA